MLPTRRHLALAGCAFVLAAASVAGQAGQAPTSRPNLLLVMVDDLGWHDTSLVFAPGAGASERPVRTPHVERLAREGCTFTSGYASAPVCSPTRVAWMTGMSPARSHVTYWTLRAGEDTSAQHPTLSPPAWRTESLQPQDGSLARRLQEAGYRTIHVGKAHWGAAGTPGQDPRALGFDVNVAGHAAGAPGSYLGLQRFAAGPRTGTEGPTIWDVPGLEAYHDHDLFLTEALALEACRAVRAALAEERPFFLYFAPYAVHTPLMANAKYLAHHADRDEREAAYATMVESVDQALGALLATLEREGVLDDTLVVFTSDNGGLSAHGRGGEPHRHNAPLRSGKGSAYEGGLRVPWIVRWPGVVEPGRVSAVPVVSHDLYPTLLAAAGLALPADAAAELDGRDLLPLLRGAAPPAERPLVFHMPHQWGVPGPGIEPFSALRLGRHKLLYFHAGERFELYDLEADLGEERDLAAAEPALAARLARLLEDELLARGARMSVVTASGRPVRLPAAAFVR